MDIHTEFKVDRSKVTFADVGGCHTAIQVCVCVCVYKLAYMYVYVYR